MTNTGARPALETVQVYVSDLVTSVTWADKELKSFAQVDVEPGESVTVDLELPADSCTLVDAEGHRIVEPGEFDLLVGPSSRTSGPADRQLPHPPEPKRPGTALAVPDDCRPR